MNLMIHFDKVGRGQKSWSVSVTQHITVPMLTRMVLKSGALKSRDVTCVIMQGDTQSGRGIVHAGLHCVGRFEYGPT